MRIRRVNSIDLGQLSRTERFIRIDAPGSFEQTLPPQHFVQPRDAAREGIRGVEECGVAVGYFDGADEQLLRNASAARDNLVAFVEQLHRLFRPDAPVTQQSADD